MWRWMTSGKLDVAENDFGKVDYGEAPGWILGVYGFLDGSS